MKQMVLDYEIDLFTIYINMGNHNSYLFESTLINKKYGRYSILFIQKEQDKNYSTEVLDLKIKCQIDNIIECFERKEGFYAGFISYDFGYQLLKINSRKGYNNLLPLIYFKYFTNYIIVDHISKKTYIQLDGIEIDEILNKKFNCIAPLLTKLNSFVSDNTYDGYLLKIRKIRKYIHEGDVYQVNLSQQFHAKGEFKPIEIYKNLTKINAAYYSALLKVEDYFIISNSPELFLTIQNATITTKPIKGTIKKAGDPNHDKKLKKQLYESLKDRSELLMIVDLVRNDLSKICKPGSVNVKKLYSIESFATVHHLVSTIEGNVKAQIKFIDIIKALFPGGSITGAPKLRAMEIINELEENPREVYTGIIGFISDSGFFNFNIAIRTLILNNNNLFFNVGGGIVWDSEPEKEFEETLHKGKAFIDLLLGDKQNEQNKSF